MESSTYDRPKLLPRMAALGAITVLAGAATCVPFADYALLLLSTGYLAVVILQTLDLMSNAARLHPTDRWICSKSGMLAAALAVASIMGVCVMVANDVEPSDLGPASSLGIRLVGFVMEIGVVLCVACLWAPRTLRHIRPRILWKVIAVPLLLLYGLEVVLLLMTPMLTSPE